MQIAHQFRKVARRAAVPVFAAGVLTAAAAPAVATFTATAPGVSAMSYGGHPAGTHVLAMSYGGEGWTAAPGMSYGSCPNMSYGSCH